MITGGLTLITSYRAAVRAGLPSIDCYFHEGELTESEILEQQLIENLLRGDLQPIEEAHAFEKLIQLNDWSSKQLAESLHNVFSFRQENDL